MTSHDQDFKGLRPQVQDQVRAKHEDNTYNKMCNTKTISNAQIYLTHILMKKNTKKQIKIPHYSPHFIDIHVLSVCV